jgi:hypothetical protein
MWEPPLAGTEAAHLTGALDRLRATFRWKADGLDATQLQTRIGASTLTIGSLVKHLAFCEDFAFTTRMRGEPPGEPWPADQRPSSDWTFASAADHTPHELYALYDGAARRSRERVQRAIDEGGLDQLLPGGLSLRRLLCDVLEEYGRHTGHADLLREAIDGRVGEDPPPDWLPAFLG